RNAIDRHVPAVFTRVTRGKYLDAMVSKYRNKTVPSVTAFRAISKMARAERAGEDPAQAEKAIIRLVTDPAFTVDEAYEKTVKHAYEHRDLTTRAGRLATEISQYKTLQSMPEDLRSSLRRLRAELNRLFGRE